MKDWSARRQELLAKDLSCALPFSIFKTPVLQKKEKAIWSSCFRRNPSYISLENNPFLHQESRAQTKAKAIPGLSSSFLFPVLLFPRINGYLYFSSLIK
uniref:Uncharacterized protein n=1 Tax=Utricularia reniformis TaxID=192314 RepID=A0A1Y0AYZ1_9LAMI|nr:hypothetical protein AEK19_MT1294 [Utricularia reniformis]ART30367.1 hypothetical protein AEK19_MT1294 [Utricularia reniformis]